MNTTTDAPLRTDLNVVDAVPWDNAEHARPMSSVVMVRQVGMAHYGWDFKDWEAHPTTIEAIGRTDQARHRAAYVLPLVGVPDALCIPEVVELFRVGLEINLRASTDVPPGFMRSSVTVNDRPEFAIIRG